MRQLTSNEIEVKVKQITEKGAIVLLYKTARVDMEILDETYGAMNWQCEYETIKDNLYCKIGVYDKEKNQWIWKQDCGIESRADGDGNEKKGEASDAFKRAGFKWGIGRELYTAPFTFLAVPTEQDEKGRWQLKERFQKFSVDGVWYDGDGIAALVIKDNKGNNVLAWKKDGFTANKENKL